MSADWNYVLSMDDVQIRLFTGEAVTQKFSVREPLAAVRFFAHGKIAGGQLGDDIGALTFATAFPPRRVFSEDEMMMPLGDLGSIAYFTYCISILFLFVIHLFIALLKIVRQSMSVSLWNFVH